MLLTKKPQKRASDTAKNTVKEFVLSAEKLINRISCHDFDIFEMQRLAEVDFDEKLNIDLFKKACQVLPIIESIVDLRAIDNFLKFIKRLAYNCDSWESMMLYFYEKFRLEDGSLKEWGDFYQCAWLLMLSPTGAMKPLLMECLDNILMVPNLLMVLRNLPGYCNVKLEATLDNSSNTEQKAPVLVIALR
ncbi:unnamed protein product [Gongylonema pulchrum]|uniref:THO complex subunit 2 n=1 Tax=Gongylonema pulchrum TaxID=637853 RepID=A0A183E6D8_9BILA|nr:unnamed protein product [Gongylonema pulchrum]